MPQHRALQRASRLTGGGGGGPAPAGNLVWGPSFGQKAGDDPTTFNNVAALDLAAIALTGQLDALADLSMPALAVNYANRPLVATANLGGTALGSAFWQSVGTVAPAAGTINSIVIPKPSGTVTGDLLLAHVVASTAATAPAWTPPAGWTTVVATNFNGTVQDIQADVYYRIADGTEGADFTFTTTAAANATGEIHRINATHPTVPINAFAVTTLNSSALNPDPVAPSVTTTAVNCLVFAFLGHGHAALSQTHTPPANHIERSDFQSTGLTVLGSTASHRTFAAAAATGTATVNCTETVATDAISTRVAIAPGTLILDP